MSKQKSNGKMGGRGYYIALALCAVAIGVSGYFYYRNADDSKSALQGQPSASVAAGQEEGVQAVATQGDDQTMPVATDPKVSEKPAKPAKTASPVAGDRITPYAMDCLCYNQTTRDWRVHNGVDIAAEAGTQVCAAADGTVYTVYADETMGMTVVIRHDGGYTTRYSSLADEVSVKPGDVVKLGQAIGRVGNSALLESALGDHLHFSVSCDGQTVDPAQFLGES